MWVIREETGISKKFEWRRDVKLKYLVVSPKEGVGGRDCVCVCVTAILSRITFVMQIQIKIGIIIIIILSPSSSS